jgi:hypothetical protein
MHTGTTTFDAPSMPEMPCARKRHAAIRFCRNTPMRLVPLATVPGRPISTRSGTLISEPPPASVFTTPAASPPAIRIPISPAVTAALLASGGS